MSEKASLPDKSRGRPYEPRLEPLERRILLASDFGDAPLPYKTLLAEGGAQHVAIGPTLGANRDTEADGVHTPRANGDDATGIDDEDGVTFGEIRVGALGAAVTVNVQSGLAMLDAWIDFNGDGSWGSPGEQVADSKALVTGNNVVSFDVPSSAADGKTYSRFRLSTAGDLGVGGAAADGEVEDYVVRVRPPQPACGSFTRHNVPSDAKGAQRVYAADVDGDGDTDVLSAASLDNKLAWYENNGSQSFAMHIIAPDGIDELHSVFAADVDGDGDTDVLSASSWMIIGANSKIAWYENDGSQNFTTHTITSVAYGANTVYAADMDGDGDIDVLSSESSEGPLKGVWWYENDGSQHFAPHSINNTAWAGSVHAFDVDGDGDLDVLSTSSGASKIAWYRNDGSQHFSLQTISTDAAFNVYASDVDGDGDADILSASYSDDRIAWYENDGSQNFTSHTITTAADGALSVYAADLDGDGDTDVVSASGGDDKIAWYENDGTQTFLPHTISTGTNAAWDVFAADVDGDGDLDVLSASFSGRGISWYENGCTASGATQTEPLITRIAESPPIGPPSQMDNANFGGATEFRRPVHVGLMVSELASRSSGSDMLSDADHSTLRWRRLVDVVLDSEELLSSSLGE